MNNLVVRYEKGIYIPAYSRAVLDRDDLLAVPGPGTWTLTEVLLHIIDCDLVFSDRMKRVISEENPTLMKFDENKWKERLFYKPEAIDPAISLFTANRIYMLHILKNLKEEDFSRTGTHSEAGILTLANILEKSITHLDHHMKFVYAKRANLDKKITEIYSE